MVGEPRGAQGARLVGPSRCQGPVTLGQCLVNPMGVTMMQRHGNRLSVGIDNEDSQVQPLAIIVSTSIREGYRCSKASIFAIIEHIPMV